MARRVSTLVVFGVFMAIAASLAAAAPVTVVLRSGDRVSGDLVDLNERGMVRPTNDGKGAVKINYIGRTASAAS